MSRRYFDQISEALRKAGIAYPVLVIDKARLDQNIDSLKRVLDTGLEYRVVAKSLPSVEMLRYIMAETGTQRLMCFHLPFLKHVIESIADADLLLGKPMPVAGVKAFYRWFQGAQNRLSFVPQKQLQWLVDSEVRLKQYEEMAASLKTPLRINLEVDIGLHRGGYSSDAEFSQSLNRIKCSEYLSLAGIMGYEAHITKIPALLGGAKKAEYLAKRQYQHFVSLIKQVFGDASRLCLNAGGSTTYPLYDGASDSCNEIATASALVKPSDFDTATLKHHESAAFIAAPVLKRVVQPALPMALVKPAVDALSYFISTLGLLPKQACFIYGGNWLATPCFPKDAKKIAVFGHSSNQEMYSLPRSSVLKEDDFMFFRPSQSEAVFLQFGKIAVYEKGEIVDWWSVFSYPDECPNGFES